MKKAELQKIFQFEKNEKGEVVFIHVLGTDPEAETVYVSGSKNPLDSMSAVYAASDLIRHKRYAANSIPGLHFHVSRGVESGFVQANIGAVSVNAPEWDGPRPTLEDYPNGWAVIDICNRIPVLVAAQNPEAMARKHNWIDALLLGYGLKIRVPVFLNYKKDDQPLSWVETMEDQIMTTSDAEALQKRSDSLGKFFDNQKLYGAILKAKVGDTFDPAVVERVNGSTLVTMSDNTEVRLEELPLGKYRVYNKGRIVRAFTWDASPGAKVLVGQAINQKWTLRKIA